MYPYRILGFTYPVGSGFYVIAGSRLLRSSVRSDPDPYAKRSLLCGACSITYCLNAQSVLDYPKLYPVGSGIIWLPVRSDPDPYANLFFCGAYSLTFYPNAQSVLDFLKL